ncbi:MAG: SHOCT domain-containing protein [Acidimicrobiaceae bacterium]|nr:SHOCT domain-containing protein [Acidimicrobiaceae bacterium]
MLWVFLFVFWVWTLIAVVVDIFRSRDMGGWAKALWFLFIVFLPIFGVLIYLIIRGESMADRAERRFGASQGAYEDWIRSVAGNGSPSVADELEKLASLRQRGVITEDEFDRQKARLVA